MSENGVAPEKGGTGLLTAGIVILLLIAAGAYLALRDTGGIDESAVTSDVEPSESIAGETAAEAGLQESAEPAPEATQEEVSETVEVAPEAAAEDATEVDGETTAPSIDEVRVDTGGTMVVAGRGEPGSRVDVLIDGEVVTSTDVDDSGAFAAIGSVEAKDAARSLTLRSGDGDAAIASAEEIILAPMPAPFETNPDDTAAASADLVETPEELSDSAPTETAETEPDLQTAQTAESAEAATEEVAEAELPAETASELSQPPTEETATDVAGDDQASEVAENQDTPAPQGAVTTEAAPAAETEEENQQIAVLRSDESGVSLVQPAQAPPVRVVLDTISYSDAGVVQLGGRAGPTSVEVRAYLDNRAVARFAVGDGGNWRGEVEGVEPGVYTLRVDALAADGKVQSRLETPFKREAPSVLAAATDAATGPVRAVTVQAGDTLWAIARERYGEGLLYVQVFEANRASIRDPDLIYPGQVFDLPGD